MSVQRIDGNPRMSKVVVHGDTVYLAGLTADKTVGQSLAEQTREILSLIDGFLGKAGSDRIDGARRSTLHCSRAGNDEELHDRRKHGDRNRRRRLL